MKAFSHTKSQRRGLLLLVGIVIILYLAFYFVEENKVLITVVDEEIQHWIDSLKISQKDSLERNKQIQPFNPNYISDFKAYLLGLHTDEIDRLHRYRKKGLFVNSSVEFQKATGVSDTTLHRLAPYFKFPEWVKQKSDHNTPVSNKVSKKKDINVASAKDLKIIYGIGEKLSQRIVDYRNSLGGFSVKDQIYEVYGLENEVIKRLLDQYEIQTQPKIQRADINRISAKDLSKLPYLDYKQSLKIVAYRTQVGNITSWKNLEESKIIDSLTLQRLKIYLQIDSE